MDPIDPKSSLYHLSAAADGPWNLIQNLTSVTVEHGSEEPTSTRVFGRTEAHLRGGALTTAWSADGLWAPADATGQGILWDAYRTKTPVYVRYLWDGTNGYRQKVLVTSVSHPNEADATNVEVSFELEGVEGSLVNTSIES